MRGGQDSDEMSTSSRLAVLLALFTVLSLQCTKPNDKSGTDLDASSQDASSRSDAAPATCNTDTHRCVAPPPTDWRGPVSRAWATNAVPVECGENYDLERQAVFGGLVAEGDCTCDCSQQTTGTSCGNATIKGYYAPLGNEAPCSDPIAGATDSLPAGGVCTSTPLAATTAIRNVKVTLGTVTSSGVCGETPQLTNTLAGASFTTAERYCASSVPPEATCGTDELCAEEPDIGFDTELCVYQEGDHACDQSSFYTEKSLRYDGVVEGRSCGACSCKGPAVGSSCGGWVNMGATCSTVLGTGGCDVDPWTGPDQGARYAAPESFDCQPAGGGVIGEATPTGVVTFCCEAPPS